MLRTSILIGVAAVLYTLAGMYIAARDEAVLVKYPKPPVPAYGALKTITHGPAVMGNIAERSPGIAVDKFSASFDCYYEAQLDGCDSDKVFVMISGTNGASYLYRDIITDMRAKGYCTINFDHRAHGRSENAAGEYTAELLAEDAAALIRSVAPGKKVHLLGWSLGGAIAYYLGIYHPDIVASISVSGMTSCFGKITEDGECDMSFDYLKAFFSTEIMIRLLGSELQGRAAMAAISMHDNEANMYFWRTLKIDTCVKTPVTWGRWDKNRYHELIKQIQAPVLLMAGGDEDKIGFGLRSLAEDAKRIPNAREPKIFRGFSHFIWFEEVGGVLGRDLGVGAMADFHDSL